MTGTNSNILARAFDTLQGRNRIINGNAIVAQRPSAAWTTSSSGFSGPDRFLVSNSGSAGGSFTQSQGTLTYNGITRFAITQTVNTPIASTAASNYWFGITQRIEGYNCADLIGQYVSISFIFATNVSGTYYLSLRDSGGYYSWLAPFTATAGVSQYYSFTVPILPTYLTIPNSNAIGMYISIGFLNTGTYQTPYNTNSWISGSYVTGPNATNWGATAGNYISVTELQLEAGQIPTNFERRSVNHEWLLCQRYYQVFNGLLLAWYTGGSYDGGYSCVTGSPMALPTPTCTATNTNTAGGYAGTLAATANSNNSYMVWFASSANAEAWCTFQLIVNSEI